jgi:hypothetical protein
LTALRVRGIRYLWAGLGLAVLAFVYVGPLAAALQQSPVSPRASSLPALSIPEVRFPLLATRKVRRPPPLPPARVSAPRTTVVVRSTVHEVTRHIPVLSDVHAQIVPPNARQDSTSKDPFANAAVVEDDVGAPVVIPSTPAPTMPAQPDTAAASAAVTDAATTPETNPPDSTDAAVASTASTNSDMSWFAVGDTGAADKNSTTSGDAATATTAPAQTDAAPTAATSDASTAGAATVDTPQQASTTTVTADAASSAPTADTTAADSQQGHASATPAAAQSPTSSNNLVVTPSTTPPPVVAPPPPAPWSISASSGSPHSISAAVNGNDLVVTIDGMAATKPLVSVSSLSVVGGDGNDTFTIDPSLASTSLPITFDGGAGTDTLNGPAGSNTWTIASQRGTVGGVTFTGFENLVGGPGKDTYQLGDDFGDLSIASSDSGNDTLDFTSSTGRISYPNASTITSTTGGTLTLSDHRPAHIDVNLPDPTQFTHAVKNAFGKVADTVAATADTAPALTNTLPLLDPASGSSPAQLLDLGNSFLTLAASAGTTLDSLAPSTVSDVVDALTAITPSLPPMLSGLVFSSAYSSSDGDLVVYVRATMAQPDAATCESGSGCVRAPVPISVSGVTLDTDPSTPGVQAPLLDVGASLGVDFAAGLNLAQGGDAIVSPDSVIAVGVSMSNPDIRATASDGSTVASVSGAIVVAGAVLLTLTDPTPGDAGIALDELPAAVTVTSSGAVEPIVLTGNSDSGPATVVILVTGGSIFGTSGSPAAASAVLSVSSPGADAAAAGAPAPASMPVAVTGTSADPATIGEGAPTATMIVGAAPTGSAAGGIGAPAVDTAAGIVAANTETTSAGYVTELSGSVATPSAADTSRVAPESTAGAKATGPAPSDDVSVGAGAAAGPSAGFSSNPSVGTTRFVTEAGSFGGGWTPTDFAGAAPDPTANTASGLSPPADAPVHTTAQRYFAVGGPGDAFDVALIPSVTTVSTGASAALTHSTAFRDSSFGGPEPRDVELRPRRRAVPPASQLRPPKQNEIRFRVAQTRPPDAGTPPRVPSFRRPVGSPPVGGTFLLVGLGPAASMSGRVCQLGRAGARRDPTAATGAGGAGAADLTLC